MKHTQVKPMGKFRITGSIKKDFTKKEEVERILSNLKRLHKISLYPQNTVKEGMVLNKINVELCGIDKTGREKIFFDTNYNNKARYPPVSTLGIEECRRRNYCVVQKAIGELVPGGKDMFKFIMPIEEFYLYTFGDNAYWIDKGSNITCILDVDEWEANNNIKDHQIWTTYNSVEICHKILNVIKKQLILNKLAGKEEETGAFFGGYST